MSIVVTTHFGVSKITKIGEKYSKEQRFGLVVPSNKQYIRALVCANSVTPDLDTPQAEFVRFAPLRVS